VAEAEVLIETEENLPRVTNEAQLQEDTHQSEAQVEVENPEKEIQVDVQDLEHKEEEGQNKAKWFGLGE
jgi:hypothetical protein